VIGGFGGPKNGILAAPMVTKIGLRDRVTWPLARSRTTRTMVADAADRVS